MVYVDIDEAIELAARNCNDDDDAAPILRMRFRGSPVTVEDSNYDTDSNWDVDNTELDDYDSLETPFSVN